MAVSFRAGGGRAGGGEKPLFCGGRGGGGRGARRETTGGGGRARRRPPPFETRNAPLLAAVGGHVAHPRAAVEVRRAGSVGRTAAIAGRARKLRHVANRDGAVGPET